MYVTLVSHFQNWSGLRSSSYGVNQFLHLVTRIWCTTDYIHMITEVVVMMMNRITGSWALGRGETFALFGCCLLVWCWSSLVVHYFPLPDACFFSFIKLDRVSPETICNDLDVDADGQSSIGQSKLGSSNKREEARTECMYRESLVSHV